MNLPKRNSADGRCYWMKPEVQEELQPLFDQCIQDAIDGRITRLDSLWPPVVVSSEGAPFEVWQLLRTWTEAQRAETLDAEKAIAFSENLRRQSRWGEIDHHLLDMLQRELQEKYFIVTGNEDDHFWDREYSLKPGIRAEQVPEPLLRFACYVAVSYKVYGMDFEYLDTNYLLGLVEKVRPDMVKKLKEHGTGRLPISLQKRKTEHFTASANDAFAAIRITARDNTVECCHEVLDYTRSTSRSGSHLARRARGLPFFKVFTLGFSNHVSSLSFRPVKISISRWAISRWVNTPQSQEPISHVCIKSPTLLPGAGGP